MRLNSIIYYLSRLLQKSLFDSKLVIPAKAGIQKPLILLDSRFHGNDKSRLLQEPRSNKNNPSPFAKRGKRGLSGEKGLTLVEVLVAMVVLSIGLLGVAMMQYVAIGGNAFGREMQIATELGQELLEQTKSTSYTDANLTAGFHSQTLTSGEPSRFGGLTFNRVWWVQNNCRNIDVALTPNDPCNPASVVSCPAALNNMKAIAVRVCWVDKNGGNHSATLNGVKWDETATP